MWLAKQKHRSETPSFSNISLLFWVVRDGTVHRPRAALIRGLSEGDPVSKKSPAGEGGARHSLQGSYAHHPINVLRCGEFTGRKEKAPPSPAGLPLNTGLVN